MRRMLTANYRIDQGVPQSLYRCPCPRRQVNIESISVGATDNPNVCITPIIDVASHDEVEQIHQTAQSSN